MVTEEKGISPAEQSYRRKRDLRIDCILRKVYRHGIECLAEKELFFLERTASELRRELNWEEDPIKGACWDPPAGDPERFTP